MKERRPCAVVRSPQRCRDEFRTPTAGAALRPERPASAQAAHRRAYVHARLPRAPLPPEFFCPLHAYRKDTPRLGGGTIFRSYTK